MDSYLIINGFKVDLIKGDEIPISYQYDSASDLLKVVRNQSTPFELPSTTRNNRFFQSTYDLHYREIDGNIVKGRFDTTRIYNCQYFREGYLEMNGSFQFLGVSIEKGVITYKGVLFSRVVSLSKSWGDLLISELDWSEYDHTLTHTIIENSWDTSVIVNGVPTNNFTAGVPDAFGYLYGLVDYGFWNSDSDFYDNNIILQVYYKEIFEKAFERMGYTIDSDFFETERFKRMVLGYGGGDKFQLTTAQLNAIAVSLTGDGTWSASDVSDYNIDDTTIGNLWISKSVELTEPGITITTVNDPLSQSDGGTLTIANAGNYRLTIAFSMDYTTNVAALGTANIYGTVDCAIWVDGVLKPLIGERWTGTGTKTFTVNKTMDINVPSGAEVKPVILFEGGGTVELTGVGIPAPAIFTVTSDFNNTYALTMDSLDVEIENGSTVNLTSAMTPMKVKDFIMGVAAQFKLYMGEPDDNNVIKIEPLEDFYIDNSTRDDWTKKVDIDRPYEIEPLAINQPKTYKWEFKQDQDYYRKTYFDLYQHGYGDFMYENPSFFAKGESVVRLPFTISPPVLLEDSGLIIPRVIERNNNVVKPFKGSPRVYYYQGLVSGAWNMRGTNAASDSAQTDYPALHHLDDTTNPTFDILFGTPSQVFYSLTGKDYTTENMISTYHWRFIDEVTSPDSKLLKCFAYLDQNDVRPNTIRTVKLIDGVLYRCKLIDSYVKNKPTRLELIKILETKSKATFSTGDLLDSKVGQFASQNPSDTKYGFRTLEVSINASVTDKYDLYYCDCTSNEVFIFLDDSLVRENHWFSILKVSGNFDVVIQTVGGKNILYKGQSVSELRIKYSSNSARIKFDGIRYTIN